MRTRIPVRGLAVGAIAGLATTAAMYLASGIAGTQPLPGLLQEPVLAVLPGPVFGFLIDRLQHAGKVLEEAGLVLAMVVALALPGVAYERFRERGVPHAGLLLGAAGWLAVALVVLPLAGDGLLGLREGVATPLVWGLLFVVYATVLELAYGSPRGSAGAAADPGRRRLLGVLPLTIGAASLGVLGLRLLPGWAQAIAGPPEAGPGGPTPALTPVASFYVVSKNFSDPVVDARRWSLTVRGLVDNPLKLSYQDLLALPATSEIVTLECISNVVGGPQISTGEFAGVPLRDLVALAQPRAAARVLNFSSRDGYTENLALSQAGPEVLVAHHLAGRPLPDSHGFPARILIPGHYGMKGPKWLEDIEVAAAPSGGFWEGQGWDPNAAIKTSSRIDQPQDGEVVRRSAVGVTGIAFAGTRGISAVQVSADGGRSWKAADLQPPVSPLAWTLWSFSWTPDREGAYSLAVRAVDGSGQLQSSADLPSFPAGSGGYHRIRVSVSG